jgi:DnaJ-class molecular chaperone
VKEYTEIIICPRCKGMGQIVTQERVHWDEMETSREQCPECHGSGRMVRHEKV